MEELSFTDYKKVHKFITKRSFIFKNRVCYPKSLRAFFTDTDLLVYNHLLELCGRCVHSKEKNYKNIKEQINKDFFFAISITEIAKEECLYKANVSQSLRKLEKYGFLKWEKAERTSRGKTGTCYLNLPVIYACIILSTIVWDIQKEMSNQHLTKVIKEILMDENEWKKIIETDCKFNNFLLKNGIKKMEEEKAIGYKITTDKEEKEKLKNELSGIKLLPIDLLSGIKLLPMGIDGVSQGLFWSYPILYYYLYYIRDILFFKKNYALPSESPCAKNHRARKSEIENFKYIFSPKGMEEILPKLIEQKNGEDTKMKNLLEKEKSPIQKKVDRIFSSWNTLPNTVKHDPTRETYKKISEYLENLLLGKPMLCSNTGKLKKEFRIFGEENNIPKEFLRREWKAKEIISILRELMKTKTKSPNVSLLNLLWARDMREEEIKKYYSPFLQSGAANLQEGVKPYRELAQMFYDAFTKQRKYPFDSAVLILYSFATKNNLSFDDMKTVTEFILRKDIPYKPKVTTVLQFTEKYDDILDAKRRWEQDKKKTNRKIQYVDSDRQAAKARYLETQML